MRFCQSILVVVAVVVGRGFSSEPMKDDMADGKETNKKSETTSHEAIPEDVQVGNPPATANVELAEPKLNAISSELEKNTDTQSHTPAITNDAEAGNLGVAPPNIGTVKEEVSTGHKHNEALTGTANHDVTQEKNHDFAGDVSPQHQRETTIGEGSIAADANNAPAADTNGTPKVTAEAEVAHELAFDVKRFFGNLNEVAQAVTTLGLTGVNAATQVQLLNTYLDLVQRSVKHMESIATMEETTNKNIMAVLDALRKETSGEAVAAATAEMTSASA